MKTKIIDKLYAGELRPVEKIKPKSKEWSNAQDKIAEIKAELKASLSDEEYSLVMDLEDMLLISSSKECEESYKYGFATGVSIINESKNIINK